MESGHEGSGGDYNSYAEEFKAIRKEIKKVAKAVEELKTQVEAHDFAMHEIEDGKKISALKKSLGMTKFLWAWVKHAEEVHPEMKLEKRE